MSADGLELDPYCTFDDQGLQWFTSRSSSKIMFSICSDLYRSPHQQQPFDLFKFRAERPQLDPTQQAILFDIHTLIFC